MKCPKCNEDIFSMSVHYCNKPKQNDMDTEELLNTIEQLKDIAQKALELAEAYSGGENEVEEELRENLKIILDAHLK